MSAKQWNRLTNIYGLVERMRCAELGLARVKLDEVEAMGERRREEMLAAVAVSRAAGGAEWALAQATRAYALREMKRLVQVREMRAEEMAAAAEEHRVSRLQVEQMKCVQEAAGTMDRMEQERRTQGSADDRFAAQRWLGVVGANGR